MELAQSLILNEDALSKLPDAKKSIFIFEWLRFLDKVLLVAQKSDIKECQPKLIQQLTNEINQNRGPPIRYLIARCLATLFSVGDTLALFETINKCNDIIKVKDESIAYLSTKLTAIICIGEMYEKLGRMVGRSYEETIQLLIKGLKNAEAQGKSEILYTLSKVIIGLGSAGSNCYKDLYKAAKNCLTDRSMVVRSAAAMCLYKLVDEAPFMHTTELENLISICYRAMDQSNYDVRCEIAKLLGHLLSSALLKPDKQNAAKFKQVTIDQLLNLLSTGFSRGGLSIFKNTTTGNEIKGSAGINREIRVGVTHAYIEFVRCMGSLWLERNANLLFTHLLSLVSNPRTAMYHVDAVYARKCVNFILRTIISTMLSERAQITIAKELSQVVIKQMNFQETSNESDKTNQFAQNEGLASYHIVICVLHELSCILITLNTCASSLIQDPSTSIFEPIMSALVHQSQPARLSAAWCLRCFAAAMPSQLAVLLDRCLNRIQHLKSSVEATSGYAFAVAALLDAVKLSPLGIPHAKGKHIFAIGEELLRTAAQNSRLSLQRTQSGWLLLGSLMTLGSTVVKVHLPRMLLLWRNSFPRSTKELESEKSRGDAFTWQVTLEARAGALAAMHSFLRHCPDLVTDDIIRRLLPSLECALTMNVFIVSIIKQYGAHLKASSATVRLRLYDVLSLLPPQLYESLFNALLRELVAEFTLTDNAANTTTSLLRSMCHRDDSIIMGDWLQETDHKAIEDQLQPNSASGSGALEHDPVYLYMHLVSDENKVPDPLPLGVAVIDSSVRLFGLVFPKVAHKHRLQMLEHFTECIKQAKSSRQQAVQINIFTAVLSALKYLAETKTGFGNIDVRKAAIDLLLGALNSNNAILLCAAGEAMGRVVQVVGEGKFIAEMAQYIFDRLKTARDELTRKGHSLALGCLHRYVGGMGAGHHLNTSVSILLALAQDQTSAAVQVWALHALALIADSGGPMFRTYVEPSLSLVLQLLLNVSASQADVHQCLTKLLAALITTVGPELHANNSQPVVTARMSCFICCSIMQEQNDSVVISGAIACLQQLHLFAPRHVNLSSLVPLLCKGMSSEHLILRRASVSCLRQLVQREAQEVSDYAAQYASTFILPDSKTQQKLNTALNRCKQDALFADRGLEGALFRLLDKDSDHKLLSETRDTLVSLLQTLIATNFTQWLLLVRDVVQASSEKANAASMPHITQDVSNACKEDEEDEDARIGNINVEQQHQQLIPRWSTKVFAIECLLKIIFACEGISEHFDAAAAKLLKSRGQGDYLVLHLNELVGVAFIAATSNSDKLRIAGLMALEEIILKFAKVAEPEFPGHVLLEQYQAQISAALRPAFSPETAPNITSIACEVCSRWICSGVARDINDIRRVHQLLVSSLNKLKHSKDSCVLYSESALTMEKLAVLRAWSEVYSLTMECEKIDKVAPAAIDDDDSNLELAAEESLLSLVKPEMAQLNVYWLAVLKDYALLSLPSEFSNQLPVEGGTFYTSDTMDSARPYYMRCWTPILYATTLSLREDGFENQNGGMTQEQLDEQINLLLGISIEAMCDPTSMHTEQEVNICLRSIKTMLLDPAVFKHISQDNKVSVEILNVLHRLLLTRTSVECFSLIIQIVQLIVKANHHHFEESQLQIENDDVENVSVQEIDELVEGESIIFATIEICVCALIRHFPVLSQNCSVSASNMFSNNPPLNDASVNLISNVLHIMTELPHICLPNTTLVILPTLLYLTMGVLKSLAPKNINKMSPLIGISLHSLKLYCSLHNMNTSAYHQSYINILRSTVNSVIEISESDEDKDGFDDTTLLLTIALFFVSCPVEVFAPPNIIGACCSIFRDIWMDGTMLLKLKCIQSLSSIIQHGNLTVSSPLIVRLVPSILDIFTDINAPCVDTQQTLVLIEAIKMMEHLVTAVHDEHREKLLLLIIPTLTNLLTNKFLHEVALQKLIDIAAQHRTTFQTTILSLPQQRSHLEEAIRAQRLKISNAEILNKSDIKNESCEANASKNIQPIIKLRAEFSNFNK